MAVVDPTKPKARPKFRKDSPDLTGREFDRLKVIEFAGRNKNWLILWRCLCKCGTEVIASSYSLNSKEKRSCGCLGPDLTRARRREDSASNTITWKSWRSMIARCEVQGNASYERYGGRGIKVCERWRNSFEAFLEDMGERPSKDYQIEREDNDGDYEPSNCRWATRKEQARNRRNNRRLTHEGETLTVAEWAERTGMTKGQLMNRVNLGWTDERILTEPVQKHTRSFRERLTANGETLPTREWAKRLGLTMSAICQRIQHGWSDEKIVNTPRRTRVTKRSELHTLTLNGKTLTVAEWAERTGIAKNVLMNRVNLGWSDERILTTPVRTQCKAS